MPGLQAEDAIFLEFNVADSLELPIVWALTVAWISLWDLRKKRARPQLYLVRAQMEARITLLRECSRFANASATVDTIIATI